MPGLPQRNAYSSSCSSVGSVSVNGIWSKHRDDVTFDQLQKFWNGLSSHGRQELLRIDKQTFLEQARKNLYCSRCNGLLLEGFSQIAMYGKSLPQNERIVASKNQCNSRLDTQDPSVHPWGGLVATRDGILTLLDCFLDAKSLTALQNVFDNARVRERECELLYPDACGGGGRGWINKGVGNYGKGHGTRETCALHTARLSCETLVDFWSSLGDEAQNSLLRMKEEDFIERLMYRFDSKRFCRDCRKNVIREYKELKELKRLRKEPRCTSWFCVADTAFQYEVSDDMIQADWHQSLTDTVGAYHHFEWAVGTGEGKSDILEFEDVGMNGSIQVNGLDLGGLSACYITLRAWKLDGRCTELSVKAHAMKGQSCVHRRLVVGDGYVTITKGESIRRFFEHAEEAEEDEDDDSMDKDGNELDGEGSRPQKHAKSPELAREFLLDAATVIFKKQVEKAFREGTARQNAHIIFVSLALKLLEERVHVACKEIITLEKQTKLLEEEEKEKREEEERKERKRTKEREKKLRRRERLRGKEMERESKCVESNQSLIDLKISTEESSPSVHEEPNITVSSEDSISETGDNGLARPPSPDIHDEQSSNGCHPYKMQYLRNDGLDSCKVADGGELSTRDESGSFVIDQSKSPGRKQRFDKEFHMDTAFKFFNRRGSVVGNDSGVAVDKSEPRSRVGSMETPSRCINGVNKQLRQNLLKSNIRINGPKYSDKFHYSNNRMRDRCEFQSCGCKLHSDYRQKDGPHVSTIKTSWEVKTVNKSESALDASMPFNRSNRYNHGFNIPDSCGIPETKLIAGNIPPDRYLHHAKKVWEPTESRKKYPRSNSDPDVTSRSSSFKVDDETDCQHADNILKPSAVVDGSNNHPCLEDNNRRESISQSQGTDNSKCTGDEDISKYSVKHISDPNISSTSSSDNCSSCLSEGDISAASSTTQNAESQSTSDSEDACQQSEGREISTCGEKGFQKYPYVGLDDKHKSDREESFTRAASCVVGANVPENLPTKNANNPKNARLTVDPGSQPHCMIPPMNNQGIHLPTVTVPSTMAYYHQRPVSWSAVPGNGLMPFPQTNHYPFSGPLGYSLSANQPSPFCMPYGALQSLPTSVLNVGQLPVYQLVNKANGVNSNDRTENSKLAEAQETINVDRPILNGWTPAPQTGFTAKSQSDSTNFSLFHFGGPVAVARGHNSNPASLKEGGVGEFSSNLPADACSQKETHVEEYSLFSASNAARFSFF